MGCWFSSCIINIESTLLASQLVELIGVYTDVSLTADQIERDGSPPLPSGPMLCKMADCGFLLLQYIQVLGSNIHVDSINHRRD